MSAALFLTHRVLWMPLSLPWRPASPLVRHCCETMSRALEHNCDQHDDPFECPDTVLVYHEPFDEYGILIRDGGMSYLLIAHCPWCRTALPASQRDRWFDALEPDGVEEMPQRYLTAQWRLPKSARD